MRRSASWRSGARRTWRPDEWLPAGDMVEMAVAVDDVVDRGLRDLSDLLDIGACRGTPQPNWIGGDHAFWCHDEHRLMPPVSEDVDVVGVVDLGGGEQRRGGRLRHRGCEDVEKNSGDEPEERGIELFAP